MDKNAEILHALTDILEVRKTADPDSSYVAKLYHKGINAITKKVGEEATEVVIAAKDNDKEQIIYEVADLWFHTMILLSHQGLTIDQVLQELEKRFGISGITEKANRQ